MKHSKQYIQKGLTSWSGEESAVLNDWTLFC